MKTKYAVGDRIRYRPGDGTYGYEETLDTSADGRIPGVVVGHTSTRVRVELSIVVAGRRQTMTRAVDAASLKLEPASH